MLRWAIGEDATGRIALLLLRMRTIPPSQVGHAMQEGHRNRSLEDSPALLQRPPTSPLPPTGVNLTHSMIGSPPTHGALFPSSQTRYLIRPSKG